MPSLFLRETFSIDLCKTRPWSHRFERSLNYVELPCEMVKPNVPFVYRTDMEDQVKEELWIGDRKLSLTRP